MGQTLSVANRSPMITQKLESHSTQLGYCHRLIDLLDYLLTLGVTRQELIAMMRSQIQEIEAEVRQAGMNVQRKPVSTTETTIGGICLKNF